MNRILQKIAPYILLAGGLLFVALGFVNLHQMKAFVKVPAVVSSVEYVDSYDADGTTTQVEIKVQYRVDGQLYEELLSFTKTNLNVGDHITVRYNPKNPHEVSGASKGGAALYFAVDGVFTAGGVAAVVKSLTKRDDAPEVQPG